MEKKQPNSRVYVRGALIGLGAGVVAAHFYKRAAAEAGEEFEDISTRDMLAISLTLLGLVRQVAETGSSNKKKKRKKNE